MDNFDLGGILTQTIDDAKRNIGNVLQDSEASIRQKLGQSIDERQKALGLGNEPFGNEPYNTRTAGMFGTSATVNVFGKSINIVSFVIMIMAILALIILMRRK